MEELLKQQQKIRFSGAGASHQNRAAEHANNTVVSMSRAILIHAALKCSEDTFSTNLFPTAMYYAIWGLQSYP